MRNLGVASFIALTYGIAWIFWLSAAPAGDHGFYVKWFGVLLTVPWQSVFFALGGMAPGAAALILRRRRSCLRISAAGQKDSAALRKTICWSIVGLLLPIVIVGVAMSPFINREIGMLDRSLLNRTVGFFLLNLPLSSSWEEFGWRGYLVSRLQARFVPFATSLIVGVVWGPWHLPRLLLLMPTSAVLWETVGLFMVQIVAISILLSWIYNCARANLLPAIIFHGSFNAMVHSFVTPITNEFGVTPYFLATILFVVTAAIVALATNGRLGLVEESSPAPLVSDTE